MPKLKLHSLKCHQTEDFLGPDEPYLVVNQSIVWGPGSLNNGASANLQGVPTIDFTTPVSIALYDQDTDFLDSDDLLGGTLIGTGQAGQGPQQATFSGDEALYNLSYEVLADPPPPLIVTPPPQVNFPVQSPEAKKGVGSTTARAWAKVSKQPDKGLIELWVHVKKTGLNGTGFAYGQVALLDVDNNTIFKTDILSKTKGANADPFNNPGVAEGEAQQDFEVPLNVLAATKTVAVLINAADNNGLPDSLQDFTNSLKQVEDLLKTASNIAASVAAIIAQF